MGRKGHQQLDAAPTVARRDAYTLRKRYLYTQPIRMPIRMPIRYLYACLYACLDAIRYQSKQSATRSYTQAIRNPLCKARHRLDALYALYGQGSSNSMRELCQTCICAIIIYLCDCSINPSVLT